MPGSTLGMMTSHGNILSPYGEGNEDHWSLGYDLWYGLRLRVIQDDDNVHAYIFQWHDTPGGDNRSPPVSLDLQGGIGVRLRLETNYDNANASWYSPALFTMAQLLGVSHDYMLRIRWDTRSNAMGGAGAIDLYVDEETTPRVQWRGQTCHPGLATDGQVPYVKCGLYKASYKTIQNTQALNTGRIYAIKIARDGSLALVKPPLPRN
jgi:hypothetical protein